MFTQSQSEKDFKLTSQYLWASKSVKNPIEDCLGIPLSSAKQIYIQTCYNPKWFPTWNILFTPSFSVRCIAAFYWQWSIFWHAKQTTRIKIRQSQPTSMTFWPCVLICMKPTMVCIGFDWLISNSTLQDDVKRWCQKKDVKRKLCT